MRFNYRANFVPLQNGDDFGIMLRPEVSLIVEGPKGRATLPGLLDTGADATILPKHLAETLGIALRPQTEVQVTVFGGAPIDLEVGEVIIELQGDGQCLRWNETVCFFDMTGDHEDQVAVLGHAGFLDYFTATFDGKECVVTLVPNDTLPSLTS